MDGLAATVDATTVVPTEVLGPPIDETLARGTKVGRYAVLRSVGAGAMGEVYAAADPELGRRIALKLMRRRVGLRADRIGRARLMREAQALARLSHPNVVPVYDVGMFDGRVFVAMALIHGQTLRRWVRAKPRSWREVVRLMIQAGEGLGAAHEAGLVHRDFKPDNVLVDDQGHVRVMDFGLARGLAQGERVPTSPTDDDRLTTTLTQTGSVMGTPGYMSPEQHAGRGVDARTDQYAFCVALFELLFGMRPFWAPTVRELARRKWHQQRRDPRHGPCPDREVPRWLRRVVERGLRPNPAQRWPSMDALLAALRAGLRPSRRGRWLSGAGLVLVLGGLSTTMAATPDPCDDAADRLALDPRVATAMSLGSDAHCRGLPPDPHAAGASPAESHPAIHRQLARAWALDRAGEYERGLALATAALHQARRVQAPRLEAEARLRLGHLHQRLDHLDQAEQELSQAVWLAQSHGADAVAARAATHLVHVVGSLRGQPEEGLAWARHAHSLIERMGDDPRARARLLQNERRLLGELSRHDEALAPSRPDSPPIQDIDALP